jgi:hypothetical protein
VDGKNQRAAIITGGSRGIGAGLAAVTDPRLLGLIRMGDANGAEREMEQHLGCLLWMRRLQRRAPVPAEPQTTAAS